MPEVEAWCAPEDHHGPKRPDGYEEETTRQIGDSQAWGPLCFGPQVAVPTGALVEGGPSEP